MYSALMNFLFSRFMKISLIIGLVFALASPCFAQTPSASPTPTPPASPEKTRAKTFGSSLQKYRPKELRDPQDRPKSNESDDVETIGVTTDLVVNDVLVTDQKGKLITNLSKDDFIVAEDGVPQGIEVFSPGENASIPRSIVLIIDNFAVQAPYFKTSVEAAKILVDKLAPQDKLAIVTADLKLRMDFTRDKTLLKRELDSLLEPRPTEETERHIPRKWREPLERRGLKMGTGLEFEALLAVLNEMFAAEDRQRIVIFQGDGNEVLWLKTDNDTPYRISEPFKDALRKAIPKKEIRNFGFSDLKEAIERSRATIYSVATGIRFLGVSKEEQKARAKADYMNFIGDFFGREYLSLIRRNPGAIPAEFLEHFTEVLLSFQTAMSSVAELSGGFTGFIEKPEDAEGVYSNIVKLISNRYVIGYYPTNQGRDGKRREMRVEVRNHPEYIVTGRKAYFAQ